MAWNDDLVPDSPTYLLAASDAKITRAVAGPGSGKSFALNHHIARLLETGVDPERILAITFTRTHAQDLKKEISSLGVPGATEVHSRTIHSHALKILMQTDVLERTGRVPRMVVEHEIFPALRDISKPQYGDIRNKKKLLAEYLAAWATLQADEPGFVKNPIQAEFEQDLIAWLKKHDGILVGEVIPVAIDFLRNNPASAERTKYDVILVDEYQDLNRSEQEFIRLILGDARIVIVGDDDQSIYGFKFAHPDGIKQIKELYGDYTDIVFDECRRCPQLVTQLASALIGNNPKRTLGTLKPRPTNPVGDVKIVQWKTFDDEIEGIAAIIKNEIATGSIQPEDVLVLTPRRLVGYKLRDQLINTGVDVQCYFRESVMKEPSVRRAYSLMKFMSDRTDKISLRFLLGGDSKEFFSNQYEILQNKAAAANCEVVDVLNQILAKGVKIAGVKNIVAEYEKVLANIDGLAKAVVADAYNAFENFFMHTDDDVFNFYELNELYTKAVRESGTTEVSDADFETWFVGIFKTLEETVTLPDSPENVNKVRVMSLHSSKGLGAKMVVLCAMIDHLIPYIKEGTPKAEEAVTIEEQRRLLYVALTRCKSSDDYQGRLVVSSFLSISGVQALRMGLKAKADRQLDVIATRFVKELGQKAPIPVLGNTLLN